jgi:long-chain acyl-CoA synthetase
MMDTKPWLKHYDEGVPHSLQPYPTITLLEVVSETARQRPDHPALLFKGAMMTYAQLEQLSNEFASSLVKLGVKKADRIGLALPNTPQMILALLGAWKAGAVAVPMNPLYTERELEFAIQECEAEIVVVLTRFYSKVKAAAVHKNPHCNCHKYQGISAAILAHSFYPAQGEKRGRPH